MRSLQTLQTIFQGVVGELSAVTRISIASASPRHPRISASMAADAAACEEATVSADERADVTAEVASRSPAWGELPELTELPGNQDADGDRSVSANEPTDCVNRRPGTCILLLETRLARTVIDSLVA
jgi:hypothetical protein